MAFGWTRGYTPVSSSAHLFAIALFEVVACASIHLRYGSRSRDVGDSLPLTEFNSDDNGEQSQATHAARSSLRATTWLFMAIGTLRALQSLAVITLLDATGENVFFASTISALLFIAICLHIGGTPMSPPDLNALLLQSCGFFVILAARSSFGLPSTISATAHLLGISLAHAVVLTTLPPLFASVPKSQSHFYATLFFLPSLPVFGFSAFSTGSSGLRLSAWTLLMSVFEAATGVLTVHILRLYGGVVFAIFSTAAFAVTVMLTLTSAPDNSWFITILGTVSIIWVAYSKRDLLKDPPSSSSFSIKRISIPGIASTLVCAHALIAPGRRPFTAADAEGKLATIYSLLPLAGQATAHCPRRTLASHSWLGDHPRRFHAFDDVLLVVFFSHARYDANVDFYRDTYAEFFPNVVFVGPASREDKGFSGSYDILVDSYKSDENLTSWSEYRMAGRMAHHMLYTAMREYDCYSGYLWAPFDTLLNVPRLMQFDQKRVWYHSPVVADYVHNPAAVEGKHAEPANIGPDPETSAKPAWSLLDGNWWWGSPYVGLPVCMPAYEIVPAAQRERLASLTGGLARLIGGSSDTAYIPSYLRESFLKTLALFLDTDCFMEIALPTTLHLVLPSSARMQYVDHWWIWQPPFSAEFVRSKWAEGYEVDTFHTFHWGEKDDEGTWIPLPSTVRDVRRLLAESAKRQGLAWPANSS